MSETEPGQQTQRLSNEQIVQLQKEISFYAGILNPIIDGGMETLEIGKKVLDEVESELGVLTKFHSEHSECVDRLAKEYEQMEIAMDALTSKVLSNSFDHEAHERLMESYRKELAEVTAEREKAENEYFAQQEEISLLKTKLHAKREEKITEQRRLEQEEAERQRKAEEEKEQEKQRKRLEEAATTTTRRKRQHSETPVKKETRSRGRPATKTPQKKAIELMVTPPQKSPTWRQPEAPKRPSLPGSNSNMTAATPSKSKAETDKSPPQKSPVWRQPKVPKPGSNSNMMAATPMSKNKQATPKQLDMNKTMETDYDYDDDSFWDD